MTAGLLPGQRPKAWQKALCRVPLPRPSPQPCLPQPWMRSLWVALAGHWPRLFNPHRPVPLALGIDRELAALLRPSMNRKRIRRFRACWCGRTAYLRALAAPRAVRHGLRGPVGPVAPEHRVHAMKRLRERQARKRSGRDGRRARDR